MGFRHTDVFAPDRIVTCQFYDTALLMAVDAVWSGRCVWQQCAETEIDMRLGCGDPGSA